MGWEAQGRGTQLMPDRPSPPAPSPTSREQVEGWEIQHPLLDGTRQHQDGEIHIDALGWWCEGQIKKRPTHIIGSGNGSTDHHEPAA